MDLMTGIILIVVAIFLWKITSLIGSIVLKLIAILGTVILMWRLWMMSQIGG